MTNSSKQPIRIIFRRSDTGEICTREYAESHPRTTERQHVRMPPPAPAPRKK